MLAHKLEWLEEYAIGVPEIDAAHEEFFRIVRRLLQLSEKNGRWMAEEGVKFLKNYVLNHFREEENYMKSIGYKDLPLHIAQHDMLRYKVAPKIEAHLERNNYSDEAVAKFLQILLLWIRKHILIHDKAIGWSKASPELNDA